jgi:hypothetical protein
VQRRSFISYSAAFAAALAARPAGSATLLAGGDVVSVTIVARPDRTWLVGTPGGCASHRPRSRRDRLASGFTSADFAP